MVNLALTERIRCGVNRRLFLARERALSQFDPGRGLQIALSTQPGWEPAIRGSLRGTPHRLTFDALDCLDLQAFDLIVPLSVESVLWLAAAGEQAAHNLLPQPPAAAVSLCHDKMLLNEHLVQAGFAEEVPRFARTLESPFFLKKRIAENSEQCFLIRNPQEAAELGHLIGHPDYFCQEIALGNAEFATHALFDGVHIEWEATVEYVSRKPAFIKGSESFVGKGIRRCHDRPLLERMLRSIGYRGLCCINYKVVDSRIQILEINPRFGGSLSLLFNGLVRHLVQRGSRYPARRPERTALNPVVGAQVNTLKAKVPADLRLI